MAATRDEFREAMARLGAAVSVVATDGPAGRCGLTASAVCSVTDAPPTLLVCINRGSAQEPVFRANGVFCVNVLSAAQAPLSALFAGRGGVAMANRFSAGAWRSGTNGAPELAGAAAILACRIADVIERGTHSILLGEVIEAHAGDAERGGLVWFGRSYHGVGAAARLGSAA